jgi:hypothetical protein
LTLPPIHTFESGATCPLSPIDTSLLLLLYFEILYKGPGIIYLPGGQNSRGEGGGSLLFWLIKYHFYKVSLIKAGLMFHKYHLLNQLQVFMRYKKNTKMSFNIPLSHFVVIFCLHSLQQARSPLFKEAASKNLAINTMYYNNSFLNILKHYFNHQFHN